MTGLLLAFWTWSFCPDGEVPVAYRVAYVHRRVVASTIGIDDAGNFISEPIYSAWAPVFVKEDAAMQAEVPCEPAPDEVCVVIVTSLDVWGMEDLGEDCSPL